MRRRRWGSQGRGHSSRIRGKPQRELCERYDWLCRPHSEETERKTAPEGGILVPVTTSRTRPADSPAVRTDGAPLRVLIVDDEENLANVLTSTLAFEGWDTRFALTGADAVRIGTEFEPDAVVLDVMLPDLDGIQVLRRLRQINPGVCVLFLTARDSVEDRIAGITAGGDDYVTKPFSLEEVSARLRGLVRRAGVATSANDSAIVVGDLVMDEDGREVHRGGDLIELTATEFELLRFLMRNPRRVLSKAQILDRVWSYDFGGRAHVVELYISYLRKKIDRDREPMIHTVRSMGYVLKPAR
jgi:two-component system OmpR family response regulator